MDDRDYDFLVSRLEGQSRDEPAAFRMKVLIMSGLAYMALFLFLSAIAALAFLLIQEARAAQRTGTLIRIVLVAVAILPLFWVTLRTFLTRLPPPEGREISRDEAPRLFAELDRIRKKLKAPAIDKVLIDERFNAAICQIPRFGLFGGHRNYLILGLPFLLGNSHDEMIATLAHEYGHLAGDHGKLGAWVYRQRKTFAAIHAKVQDEGDSDWISGLVAAALNAFAPYFNAYTFVLSRLQEYEADAAANRIAGREANSSGLIRGELLGQWIAEDFWPRLYAQIKERAEPLFMPHAAMRTAFAASHDEWANPERLRQALRIDSGLEDTHPCLRERLEAIDAPPALPPPTKGSSAETLLGPLARRLIDEFDQEWWSTTRKDWQSRHHQISRSAKRLAELAPRPLPSLDLFELQELANLQAESEQAGAAMTTLEHLLHRPGGPFAKAEFLQGRLLLAAGNDKGLISLAKALRGDARLADQCLHTGYWYLHDKQGEAAAQSWVDEVNT